MSRTVFFILLGCICGQVYAQKDPAAVKYAAYISAADARRHLTILASDEFEGRETGKPGAARAANYIAAEFKKLGLKAPVNHSYFMNVPLVEPVVQVGSFVANGRPYVNNTDFYVSGYPDKKTIHATAIVFAGYGISTPDYDDLKDADLTGKVVMIMNQGEPVKDGVSLISKTASPSDWAKTAGRSLSKRIQALQGRHPALILAVSDEVSAAVKLIAGRSSRLLIKDQVKKATTATVFNITPAMANSILKTSGKTIEGLKNDINSQAKPLTQVLAADLSASFTTAYKDVKAVNVLGYLPGTDLKEELLVFSAHYDHIGLTAGGEDKVNNGADDDGSGTTGILEIARAFSQAKKQGHGPRRSILFLANVGEEKGLLGSEYYSSHPVFPLQQTIADLNIDMIGRVDPAHAAKPEYCYLIGSDKLSTTLHKISENANATYTQLTIDYKYNDPKDPERIYYRSDHYNFAKHNIPIIFYFNGVHEDYHKPGDEVSKINFELLVKRTQLVFYTGWELANRNERPAVDVTNDMPQSR